MDKGSVEQQTERLGEIFRSLETQAVEPGGPLYVDIWEGSAYDPVMRMRRQILFSSEQSLQLFSGFSGAGKTTQLLRLKKELAEAGYLVIYADAEDYLNLGEPIDISDLLYTIAGAFSDGLANAGVQPPEGESYWARFRNFLSASVEIKEITIPAGFADLKAELRENTTFRQKLQQSLALRLRELAKQAHEYVEEGIRKVHGELGPDKRVVFMLDSLEKLRATPSNEQEMMDRLERLFRNNLGTLKFPWVHCVYSVPAWLREVVAHAEVTLIPSIKLQDARGSGAQSEHGWGVLRELILRRTGMDGCRLLFGEPNLEGNFALLDRLIGMSGGAPRDLLRLAREAVLLAQPGALPLRPELIETAIASVRNEMRVSVQDAYWLDGVAKTKAADLPTSSKRDINHYMRMLDNHFILCFRNASDWYDVHPLIQDEVKRIVSLHPPPQVQ